MLVGVMVGAAVEVPVAVAHGVEVAVLVALDVAVEVGGVDDGLVAVDVGVSDAFVDVDVGVSVGVLAVVVDVDVDVLVGVLATVVDVDVDVLVGVLAVVVDVGVFVGVSVGVLVGVLVGVSVGVLVGVSVGVLVGVSVGVLVGVSVGVLVGVLVGVSVGVFVGVSVGVLVGVSVGVFGTSVGVLVGVSVGVSGTSVGVFVGVSVGGLTSCAVNRSVTDGVTQTSTVDSAFADAARVAPAANSTQLIAMDKSNANRGAQKIARRPMVTPTRHHSRITGSNDANQPTIAPAWAWEYGSDSQNCGTGRRESGGDAWIVHGDFRERDATMQPSSHHHPPARILRRCGRVAEGPHAVPERRSVLITGGAGFIGINVADRALTAGDRVTILDDLSRPGVRLNLDWLRGRHGDAFTVTTGSVTDARACLDAVAGAEVVYHLAGQTAVTTSIADPRRDFEANALGTLNVLEAARLAGHSPIVLYASTNKVYGGMEDATIVELPTRHAYRDLPEGVSERQPLDFHSPYGCSKGAGDQYVRDYARIYGLPTVVFRQSCIYGPRQMGVEDQGWLAWFLIALVTGRPITIYGDGKQVRDLLYVDDLLDAYDRAIDRIDTSRGQVYNVGGGPGNAVSIWCELRPLVEDALGRPVPDPRFEAARPGDQSVFIADIGKARRELGWEPRVDPSEGIRRLIAWVTTNRGLFERAAACAS